MFSIFCILQGMDFLVCEVIEQIILNCLKIRIFKKGEKINLRTFREFLNGLKISQLQYSLEGVVVDQAEGVDGRVPDVRDLAAQQRNHQLVQGHRGGRGAAGFVAPVRRQRIRRGAAKRVVRRGCKKASRYLAFIYTYVCWHVSVCVV